MPTLCQELCQGQRPYKEHETQSLSVYGSAISLSIQFVDWLRAQVPLSVSGEYRYYRRMVSFFPPSLSLSFNKLH